MKVYELRESFGLENVVAADRPEPRPEAGQVKIKVKAASVNYRDLLMVKGLYNPRQKLPLIPLSDGVGEVVEVGPDVTRVSVGERVAGAFVQGLISLPVPSDGRFQKQTLGGPLDGMLAEQVVLPQEGVVRVPEHLSDVEAATLPCAAVTAWNALFTQGDVKPGDTVVVQGTGGVSIFALQFASMVGARVIVTSSSNDKLERAKGLGATDLINYKEKPEWGKEVKALTGIGADHIIEVGGAGTLAQSLRAVRAGGQISVIGVLAGGQGDLNITPILMRNIRLQGVFVGSRTEFETMNRAVSAARLKPIVDKTFPFAEATAALKYVDEARHFGKVCIGF